MNALSTALARLALWSLMPLLCAWSAGPLGAQPRAPVQGAREVTIAPGQQSRAASTVARASVPPGAAVLEAPVGNLRVEMGRLLRLRLSMEDPERLWRCLRSISHTLAPAAGAPVTTSSAIPLDAIVHWSDPLASEALLPMRSGTVELYIEKGRPRVASYYLTWRLPGGDLALTAPAPPARFKAEIIGAQTATVLEGTGNLDDVIFGERVPIRMRIFSASPLSTVTVYHRSQVGVEYSSSPASRTEGAEPESLWVVELDRPPGLEAFIEYWADIEDVTGNRSSYGTAELPFRVRLLDPTAPNK